MIIYEQVALSGSEYQKRRKMASVEYVETDLNSLTEQYSKIKNTKFGINPQIRHNSWIHSWFIDKNQENIVNTFIQDGYEAAKRICLNSIGEFPADYFPTIKFCNDGFSVGKYDMLDGGPFEGFNLLSIAFTEADKDGVYGLIQECNMDVNAPCYGNPTWTAALPTHQGFAETLRDRFQILKELCEQNVVDIPFKDFRSAKAKDTIFHLAMYIKDDDLRGDILSFFAEKAPEVASIKNMFGVSEEGRLNGLEGVTPMSRLCDLAARNVDGLSKETFIRDLGSLIGCGVFNEYHHTPEYETCLDKLPIQLKDIFSEAFTALPSRSPSPSTESSNIPANRSFEGGESISHI